MRRGVQVVPRTVVVVLLAVVPLGSGWACSAAAGQWHLLSRTTVAEPRFYPVPAISPIPYGPECGYAVPAYSWGYLGVPRRTSCDFNVHTGYSRSYLQFGWPARY